MGAAHHRGSSKQDYQTPPEFIKAVKDLIDIDKFAMDLAASPENTQAEKYFTEADDSLSQDWTRLNGVLWLNPPYDKIAPWVQKCHESIHSGASIVVLVPASVGSNWYRDHVHNVANVLFLNKRIKFVGAKDAFPKDLMLCFYTTLPTDKAPKVWDWHSGKVY